MWRLEALLGIHESEHPLPPQLHRHWTVKNSKRAYLTQNYNMHAVNNTAKRRPATHDAWSVAQQWTMWCLCCAARVCVALSGLCCAVRVCVVLYWSVLRCTGLCCAVLVLRCTSVVLYWCYTVRVCVAQYWSVWRYTCVSLNWCCNSLH